MQNYVLKLFILGLFLATGTAHAVSLGKMTTLSGLNQPFEAEIQLHAVAREELDSLKVGIASVEAFARANIDRPFILSNLNFETVAKENGQTVIRVSSRRGITEPYLNFLLEVSGSGEKVVREYAVLLDLPR
ncbi:MAG: hypothetical protein P8Y20_00515 [Gammaproteobacteria bacterium]